MWWNLALGVVFNLISFLLRPKPEPPKPTQLDDIDVPVTKEGTEIPKVYGTVWIDSPMVHWYGDFKTVAIKSKGGKK